MYFLSYLFKFMPLYFISHFSSWLGLACIVMFLISIVHSYVAPTLNKLNNNNNNNNNVTPCMLVKQVDTCQLECVSI